MSEFSKNVKRSCSCSEDDLDRSNTSPLCVALTPLPTFVAHFDEKRPFQTHIHLLSKSKSQFFQNFLLVFSCICKLSGAFQSTNVSLYPWKVEIIEFLNLEDVAHSITYIKLLVMYRTRAILTLTFYLQNQFFGPDFEISDCRNAYKTSANHNETSSIYFSCANSSKNNIKAWIGQQRGSI